MREKSRYIVAREVSEQQADDILKSVRRMGVAFVAADWLLTRAAAGFKARQRMSSADCYAGALAQARRADLPQTGSSSRLKPKSGSSGWAPELSPKAVFAMPAQGGRIRVESFG